MTIYIFLRFPTIADPVQLAVEVGQRYTEPVLVRVVQRNELTGAHEWTIEEDDVRYGPLLHDDLHDLGECAPRRMWIQKVFDY